MTDTAEDIYIKVSSQVIIEIIKETASGISIYLDKKLKEKDFFNIASKKYSNHLYAQLNTFRLFGMQKSGSLSEIYVEAGLYESITDLQQESYSDLKNKFDFKSREFEDSRSRLSIRPLLNSSNFFIIIGKPGSGKTTLLKHIVFESLTNKGFLNEAKIPIFITLREFEIAKCSLLDFIINQFNLHLTKESEELVTTLIEKGKCIVLLDGLDEASESAKFLIPEIRNFATKYPQNHIILSCRSGGYYNWFENFPSLELAEFNQYQKNKFIKNWFSVEEKYEDLIAKLEKNIPVNELAKTPLLLALLCITYNEKNRFPENRSKLYQSSLEILTTKWDKEKSIERNNPELNLSNKEISNTLSKIGFDTYQNNEIFFPKNTLKHYIERTLQSKGEIDGNDIIGAIEINSGILSRRSNNVYSFSHLTFQEFYAANFLANNYQGTKLNEKIDPILLSQKWSEVIAILAGLIPDAEQFIMFLRTKLDSIKEENNKLKRFLLNSTRIIKIEETNILEKFIAIYLYLTLIGFKSNAYLSGKIEIISLLKKLRFSHNMTIPQNFNQIHLSVYKRTLNDIDMRVIEVVCKELEIAKDVAHKLLYIYNLDLEENEIESFIRFKIMEDEEFNKLLPHYFKLSSIYYDCLCSDPYLVNHDLNELKNQILE